ncbi:fimbrial biogenesis chaperone [Agaribacter marinus]|uniref:Pili assembly chaperone N-terminal domain-containing protein n=1 Tax=Agaribacter marinus TaxID=1431249 RepID=A0AA37WK66_9ALTE|nr:fimbria/pilus periplasmic chaperone [Agaribacter marinus]GLR70670.1 hypothetical protein GCM10007852_15780 [Agaribacter marinus]
MKWYIILCVSCVFTSINANASLLIAPTRINFDSNDRVKEVLLVNNGNQPRTYRISWTEKKALAQGGYEEIVDESNEVNALSPFMRFSPRQVRLAPGERQTIKLQLRKKSNMSASEYRSHLVFSALPIGDDGENSGDGIRLRAQVMINYSIPVLFHPRKGNVSISLANYGFVSRHDNGVDLALTLKRSGDISSFGRIEIYNGVREKQTQVGILNNVHVYQELDQAFLKVRIPNKDALDLSQPLNVVYHGEKEHFGDIFFEEFLNNNLTKIN